MVLALAVLLFHPQALPQSASQLESRSITTAAATAEAAQPPSSPARTPSDDVGSSTSVSYQPGHVTPVPVTSLSSASDSAAPADPPALASYTREPNMTAMMISVVQLRAEAWRKRKIWYGLALANHSAAGFDAWTTNHEVAAGQGRELNPLMKPFAGNPSIYVATQVGPAILDFVGRRMMYSHHAWIRNAWWLPQALGTAGSLACGSHNLTVQAATNP